ncbi:uncharacterized protein LOC108200929 isoform X3 [Daucus carota subsp. sativus]|uniref:uncharacterized protein LOC108200929 isoform X3 n=1 Tax=Daucus carota subsp. sativus TaxID=79200 RepID=UPI003083D9FC
MSKPSRPLKIGAPEMNSKLKITNPNGEDRLSSLPDELIHQILSFLGTRQAVQTSILSKRWKRMWTGLPVLSFDGLPESMSSISVPCLTTLIMKRAKLPENVWDLPALLSLELDEVDLPANMNDFFSALVSVRDITISFSGSCKHNWIISCPQLVHLKICTNFSCICWIHEIAVLSNKLRELSLVGIFMVRSKVHELENVSVKLWDTNEFNDATLDEKGLHYDFVIPMLSELGNARTLTLDSAMIEALYTVSNSLGRVPSPFKNLKYVKLPQGNKESGISTTLRKYLLGGNPRATIVTSLPQVLYTVSNHLGRVPSPFKNLKYVKLPQGNKESGISTTLRKYLLGGNPRATIVTSLPQFHRYKPFKLSTFSSDTLKKLKLRVPLDYDESLRTDSEWVLPALKALHLIRPPHMSSYNFSEYCLIWLPNLTTLCLDGIRLPESLSSISVPCLTTLIMKRAKLPENVWDLPALLSLELDEVDLPANMTDFFSALVSVRDITISFSGSCKHNWMISCPQLVHLKICTNFSCICWIHEIAVLSNKLRELSLVGIFMVRSKVHELENVSVKLWDTNEFNDATLDEKGLNYDFVIPMLSELGNARTLTLDSAMIEALYTVSNNLGRVPSPFKNLKYVKLPQGNKESGISTTLRKYLLGGNPRATIVTSLPQRKLNHQVVSNSSTSQKVCVDTGKRVQGESIWSRILL